jgi:succinylglutamic semialdehyde dehydrogenase
MISLESALKTKIEFRGSWVAGRWTKPVRASGSWEVVSPANLDWALPSVSYSFDTVGEAVEAGRAAFASWSRLPQAARTAAVLKFGEELGKRADLLARLIAVETGKPFDEALGEVALLQTKIRVTIDEGLPLIADKQIELGQGARGQVRWFPKGMLVVVGPFNFPVHLPNGHIVPALLAGNVCVFKPSEKTPYSAQVYAEAAEAAGLPTGVFQLLQGTGEVATRLIRHPGVDGVLATCSYDVGVKIRKELVDNPEKIIALEMGGKNGALVLDGSDVDAVASHLIRSAFLSTGQRCTALSRVYVSRALLDPLVLRVHEAAKELIVSQPFDEDPKPFMGPLISAAAKEKFLRYSNIAEGEKAEAIMRPKALEGVARMSRKPLPHGHYVSPSIHVVPSWSSKSAYQTHEIFGPDLFFCPVDDPMEGLEALNSNSYGLVASVFTPEEKVFEELSARLHCGLVYHNRPTVGASARLPFGGWKQSGNHRPAGIFAILSTVQAQSRIF